MAKKLGLSPICHHQSSRRHLSHGTSLARSRHTSAICFAQSYNSGLKEGCTKRLKKCSNVGNPKSSPSDPMTLSIINHGRKLDLPPICHHQTLRRHLFHGMSLARGRHTSAICPAQSYNSGLNRRLHQEILKVRQVEQDGNHQMDRPVAW